MKTSEGHLEVVKTGFYASIQDLGRFGHGHWGIPVSGAMDQQSYQLSNHLLQNPPEAACIEMTMIGGEFLFHHPTTVVLTGAPAKILINGTAVAINQLIDITEGDSLKIAPMQTGCRMYLGIKGGFQSEKILGSRSWYPGITKTDRLKERMILPYRPTAYKRPTPLAKVSIDDALFEEDTLEAYPGAEATELGEDRFEQLFTQDFHLSPKLNRMGILLEEKFENNLMEILTAPVYPGTVQLTPGGKLLVLMRDAQVTGGYPRILQLSPSAISILSQKKQGDKIRFKLISDW